MPLHDDADVPMLKYHGLLPEEKERLMPLDEEIATMLTEANVTDAMWTAGDEVKHRMLQLRTHDRTFYELRANELGRTSDADILAHVKGAVEAI